MDGLKCAWQEMEKKDKDTDMGNGIKIKDSYDTFRVLWIVLIWAISGKKGELIFNEWLPCMRRLGQVLLVNFSVENTSNSCRGPWVMRCQGDCEG